MPSSGLVFRSEQLNHIRNIMEQYIEFVGNHPWMFAALAGTIGLLIFMEYERLTAAGKNISPMEATRLQNDGEVLVLDVREEAEFKRGHMINAVHMPMSQIEKRVNEISKFKAKPVITVCESGMRAQRACKTLKKHGFEDLNSLAGGMGAWGKANMPVASKS